MANATKFQVNVTMVDYTDTAEWWPLVGGAVYTGRYPTGAMIGVLMAGANKGFATHLDDSAAMKFLGIVFGKNAQVDSADGNGVRQVRVKKPRLLEVVLNAPITWPDDIGKPVIAIDNQTGAISGGTNDNLIGYIERPVRGEDHTAFTGWFLNRVLVRPAWAYQSEVVA